MDHLTAPAAGAELPAHRLVTQTGSSGIGPEKSCDLRFRVFRVFRGSSVCRPAGSEPSQSVLDRFGRPGAGVRWRTRYVDSVRAQYRVCPLGPIFIHGVRSGFIRWISGLGIQPAVALEISARVTKRIEPTR